MDPQEFITVLTRTHHRSLSQAR